MIVVDASALLAVHLWEPDRQRCLDALERASASVMSPVNWWEVLVRAHAIGGALATEKLRTFRMAADIEVTVASSADVELAFDAFVRFGRRTPARLNLGDCFAYALAKARNAPLLFVGEDFLQTDLQRA